MNQAAKPPTRPDLNGPIVLAARLRQNAEVMQQVLNQQGLECAIAHSIESVVAAIHAEAALIIITEDVLVTHQSLDQLIEALNQQPDWSDIPMIFLLKNGRQFSTYITFLRHARYQRSVTLLEMPLKRHELLSVVQSCLHNRRRQYLLRDTLYRLQESNQALENFSHTVAHELRNPLSTITTSLNCLNRLPLDSQQKRFTEIGLRSSRKMDQTMRVLLEYGKLSANTTIQFESVNMASVLEEAVQELQTIIDTHQAHVEWIDLPMVWGNAELLRRLVSNLIKNAIIHNDAQPPVVLVSVVPQSNLQADKYQFQVRDNGPGIAPNDQQQIFDMFSCSRKTSGSGIGLALCRRIVEHHHGTITVQSELGQGSSFYFDLPKASDS